MKCYVPAAAAFVLVNVMVTGLGPQLNVMLPPLQLPSESHPSAAFNAASVQLAAVPVPTTPLASVSLGENEGATTIVATTTAATADLLMASLWALLPAPRCRCARLMTSAVARILAGTQQEEFGGA